MKPTITNWKLGRDVWRDFTRAHPELGYIGNVDSWMYFKRRYGEHLKALDILRQTGARRAMIADVDRFEREVFDLLTRGVYEITEAAKVTTATATSHPGPPTKRRTAADADAAA